MHLMLSTWGAKPVRCLRWLLTRLDFLMIEWKLSLEIFSMRLSSSPFLYFSTKDIDIEIKTFVSTNTYVLHCLINNHLVSSPLLQASAVPRTPHIIIEWLGLEVT